MEHVGLQARLVAPLDRAAAAGSSQLRALIVEVASPGAEEHARAAHEYGDNGDDGAEYEQERAHHDVDGGASLLVRAGLARVEECGGAKEDPQAVEGGEAEEEEQPAWLGLGVRVRVGVGVRVGVKVGVGVGVRVRARARPASAAAPGISSTSSPIWAEDQQEAPSSHAPSECALPPAET